MRISEKRTEPQNCDQQYNSGKNLFIPCSVTWKNIFQIDEALVICGMNNAYTNHINCQIKQNDNGAI